MARYLTRLFGTGTPTRPPRPCPLRAETLEAREVPATLSGGLLTIPGTPSDDVVKVDYLIVAISVTPGQTQETYDLSRIRVTQNGWSQTFNANEVSTIRFDGGSGQDQYQNFTGASDNVTGGYGNDTLIGGTGFCKMSGDDGADFLDARNSFRATLSGGSNEAGTRDTLYGGNGHDVLNGDAGDDFIEGFGGDDTISGGMGSDVLIGDSGDDSLYGGSGTDTLDGGTGGDYLDGGADKCRDLLTGDRPGNPEGDTFVRYVWDFTSPSQEDSFTDFSYAGGDRIVYVDLNEPTGSGSLWAG